MWFSMTTFVFWMSAGVPLVRVLAQEIFPNLKLEFKCLLK